MYIVHNADSGGRGVGNVTYTIRPMYKYVVTEILLCGLRYLCLNDTCFFPRPELRQHPALYTLHKIPRNRAPPSGPPNIIR